MKEFTLIGSDLARAYFSSPDCSSGIPWCHIHTSTWHILLPFTFSSTQSQVQAHPVRDRSEPDQWRWRIAMGYHHLPLYHRCLTPFRPGYPDRPHRIQQTAVLYNFCSTTFFDAPAKIQSRRCPLTLMRA